MHKRHWFHCFTVFAALLALTACGFRNVPEDIPSVISAPLEASLPPIELPSLTPSVTPASDLPGDIRLELFLGGRQVQSVSAADPQQKQVVMDAVLDSMLRSAAWPAVNTDNIKDRLCISIGSGSEDAMEYTVFDLDGRHCMQKGNGMYTYLSDKAYQPLFDLAMGCRLPYVMTVTSGKNSILAAGFTVWTKRKEDIQHGTEMARLKPQDVAGHIPYLELDPERDSATPFTPYVGGKEVYGAYALYDDKLKELTYFPASGLKPQTYLFKGASPGKYIVELDLELLEGDMTAGRQYFFGVVIP